MSKRNGRMTDELLYENEREKVPVRNRRVGIDTVPSLLRNVQFTEEDAIVLRLVPPTYYLLEGRRNYRRNELRHRYMMHVVAAASKQQQHGPSRMLPPDRTLRDRETSRVMAKKRRISKYRRRVRSGSRYYTVRSLNCSTLDRSSIHTGLQVAAIGKARSS
jgi:hypothetical protein